MKKILFDTSAYSILLRGNTELLKVLEAAETVYVPAVVLAELLAGFKGGSREQRNKKILEEFIARPPVAVLDVTRETAEIFAGIFISLKAKGTPLPIHDVWIGAHAFEQGAVVVTADEHFKKIDGLRLWLTEATR
jgi:tRNA(fMet)-specific endonuclease VapC